MALDRQVASGIAESELKRWLQRSYTELCEALDETDKRTLVGSDGVTYHIASYTLPDRGDDLRVVVAVDDGSMSAVRPVVRDIVIRPDGSTVD